ncbi:MAG: response regulator [Proteobacteria bacterium]|nr:response regulator [Pseudomonadota bacterium]
MPRLFSSLKSKFLFFFSLIFGVTLLIHFLYLTPLIKERELEETIEFQGHLAQQLQITLENSFQKTINELEAITFLIEKTGMEQENLDRILTEMDAVTQFFNYHFILDAEGYWLSRPSKPDMVGKRLSNRSWVNEALAAGKTSFLDVHQAQTSKALVTGFVTPIHDAAGQTLALMRGVYVISEENSLLKQVKSLKFGKGGYAYIVDSTGRLIVDPKISLHYENFTQYDFKELPPVARVLKGESGSVEFEDEGSLWVASYRPIPTTGWGVIVQQPKAEMLKLADEEAGTFGKFIFFTFLLMATMVVILGHYTLRPLSRLAEAIRGGKPCSPDYFPQDEVGLLAGSINTYRENLEDLVVTRTAELEKEVAAHQQAKEILLASEEKYRSFVQNFNGIAFRGNLDFTLVFFHGNVAEITGYSEDEFLSGSIRWDQIIHPDDLASLPGYKELRTVKDYSCSREYRIRHKSGATRWVSERNQNVCDEKGEITWVQGIIYDITRKKQEEEEQKLFEQKLQHVQKLESLGILAGGIAHDFNNLLMGIMGHTELAQIKVPPLSPAHDNLRAIQNSTERAADLCGQMLAYSGKGHFVTQALNLNELVHEMTHMLEVSISKKASLKINLDDQLPAFNADVTQIRQILMNLIVNASEALGDETGLISISTGTIECDSRYFEQTLMDKQLPAGKYVYLEVADTGVGMDSETRDKLFDPFFTTKFTGRGLGLSAVLGIIRGHQGGIIVYSEKGKGSTFKLLFPALEDTLPRSLDTSNNNEEQWRGQGTILLVDDDEIVLEVGKEMIEYLGFTVLTAVHGLEALEVFRRQPAAIDCVILDLTMPQMGGEEALVELRKIRPDIRVIMSSGYNEQEISRHFSEQGTVDFIQKPYQIQMLSTKLRDVLGG